MNYQQPGYAPYTPGAQGGCVPGGHFGQQIGERVETADQASVRIQFDIVRSRLDQLEKERSVPNAESIERLVQVMKEYNVERLSQNGFQIQMFYPQKSEAMKADVKASES